MGLLESQRHTYATPYEVWEQVETLQQRPTPPTYLLPICEAVADEVDKTCRRHFYPVRAALPYNRPEHYDRLQLHADLLEIVEVTVGRANPQEWVEGTHFWRAPLSGPRIRALQAEPGCSFHETSEVMSCITVDGVWAYARDSLLLDETVNASLGVDDTVTEIPVQGGSPDRLAGAMLQIDDEALYVTAATPDALTVERGALGTTAAAHVDAAGIYRLLPPPLVHTSSVALAVREYRRIQSAFTDVAGVQLSGDITYARAMPADVERRLQKITRTMFS